MVPSYCFVRKTSGQVPRLHRGVVVSVCLGLLISCAIGNVIWLDRHWLTLPPPWDQAFYLYMGLRYLHALVDYGPIAAFREFIHLSTDVAPLYPLTTLLLYLLFGPSRLVAYLTNIVYLGLLLAGVYLLGVHLYGRRAGLLAAFIAATFTATVNYSRDYLLEFPATAFVTLGVYALLRSEEFHHRTWCLTFGAFVGLSVLTKTMTGVFFVGPVLFGLGVLAWRHQLNGAVLRNFLLAVGVGMLVAAIWWGPNFRTAVRYLVYYGFQAGAVPYSKDVPGVLSLENLSYYALHLTNHGLSLPYTLLFVGLIIFVGTKALFGGHDRHIGQAAVGVTEGRYVGYLWAWFLVGYTILTLVPNKGEERYAQPLLPPMALLLSGGIDAIGRPWVRRGMIAVTLAVGSFNYLGLTYDLPRLPQRLYISRLALISHEYPHYEWVRSKIPAAQDYDWPGSAILSFLTQLTKQHTMKTLRELRLSLDDRAGGMPIEEEVRMIYQAVLRRAPDSRALHKDVSALGAGSMTRDSLIDTLMVSDEFKNRRPRVLVVPDHPQFNASTLRYIAELDRVLFSFSHMLEGPVTTQQLQQYEFILVKNGGYQGPEFSTRYADQTYERLLQPGAGFIPLPERFPFPDHSYIVIFATSSL
jgi:4-amino-4-deoxy-L-arabinose transferase-like glycosyltransferase